jgi:hypothetical protein
MKSWSTEEYWQVLHPGCGLINYFRFVKPNMWHTKAPIVRCRCKKHFSLFEAEHFIGGVYERIEPTPLVKRQADRVEFINPHAVESASC